MARYIYAIWVPSFDYELQEFEKNLEWTRKAYDYSYANLIEGESAGLLAFGMSYSSGLFTRQDNRLGQAMTKAALTCEFEMPELEDILRSRVTVFVDMLKTAERVKKHQQYADFEEALAVYCQ